MSRNIRNEILPIVDAERCPIMSSWNDNHDNGPDEVYVPSEVIMTNIFPYLDRTTWNYMSMTNHEIQQESQRKIPPWPDQRKPNRVTLPIDMAFSIDFSPGDGRYLVCGSFEGQVLVWDSTTGHCRTLQEENCYEDVRRVVFPDQNNPHCIRTICNDGKVRHWEDIRSTSNAATTSYVLGQMGTRIGHSDKVALSSDGTIVALGRDLNRRTRGHCNISIWSIVDGICLNRWIAVHVHFVDGLEICCPSTTEIGDAGGGGGRYLAASFANRVCVWDIDSIVQQSKKKKQTKTSNGVSQGNINSISGTNQIVEDNPPFIPPCMITKKHRDQIRAIAWSYYRSDDTNNMDNSKKKYKKTRYLACGLVDATIWIWSVPDRTCVLQLGEPLGVDDTMMLQKSSSIYAMTFSPDGTMLVSGSEDGTIRLWDTTSTTTSQTQQDCLIGDAKAPTSTTNDNVSTATCIETCLKVHQDRIWCMAVTPSGQTVASYSTDATIRFQPM